MIMRNNIRNTSLFTDKVSNPIANNIIFSGPNNTKYLVPLWTLINSSVSANVIRNGFAPSKVLYKMSNQKKILCDFSSIKRSKSESSIEVMLLKSEHVRCVKVAFLNYCYSPFLYC